jgi:hypothetical protein
MGRFFLGMGIVLAVITWLWTSVAMFLSYGLLWALVAFFFPPADLLAMFVVGTWHLGLTAIGAWGLGAIIESRKEAI